MSGILDPKTRIMDVHLTEEGRRQVCEGSIRIVYASFSDSTTFYQKDLLSGSADTGDRLFFEACSSPYDQVTFEADDSGRLNPTKNTKIIASNGLLLTGSGQFVTGSNFINSTNVLLSSSLQAFKNNYLIGTIDPLFENEQFGVSADRVNFSIAEGNPIASTTQQSANVTTLDSLFQDERMAHLPNFMYLPPVNRSSDRTSIDFTSKTFYNKHKLGNYPRIDHGKSESEVQDGIRKRLEELNSSGNSRTIQFDPTSNLNNLHCQFFEFNSNQIRKLDIVDFGTVKLNADGSVGKIYFVGKVYVDDFGNHTFVNIFNLVFE